MIRDSARKHGVSDEDMEHALRMTDEQMADWIENANDGQGPTPVATTERADLDELIAALRVRDQAEDDLARAAVAAHASGASWAAIGAVIGLTRQGAHRRYSELVNS